MKRIFNIYSLAMLFSLLISTVSSPPDPVQAAATWQYVGPAGFTGDVAFHPSLALHDGTPFMAFQDVANGYKASVMKFNGTDWVNVGPAGFSSGMAHHLSLALHEGTPYVAFSDGANGEKLSLMKFNGTGWVNVGPAGFSSRAWYISLAFDSGTPYVAFADIDNGGPSVMKFDGTNWVSVGTANISNAAIDSTSLAFDSGTPYIAFSDFANGSKANVMKFDGVSWVNVGSAGFSPGTAGGISLALDGGVAYLAFADGANAGKASVMKFNGTNWVNVGPAGFSGGEAYYTSLEFDNDTPYVAFSDVANGHETSVMKFDALSGSWVNVGPAGFSNRAQFVSLVFEGGVPYVAFQDVDNDFDISVMNFVEEDFVAPMVASIVRTSASPTGSDSVTFRLRLTEAVSGLVAGDLSLHATGDISGASISGLSGSGDMYMVTVNTGSGNGTIRLAVPVSATITDLSGNLMGGLPFFGGETYTILKTATFSDVQDTYWAWNFVERLYNAGITGGCSVNPPGYCPESTVTRAQMAVFLLRGIHGSSYNPPSVGGNTGFGDVPIDYWSGAWIKRLTAEGISTGCGFGNYCPESPVTRAQMAVFLLRSKYGSSYNPPGVGSSTGFSDVPAGYWAGAWIKQLVAEGITSGCGAGTYCPETPVTRAQMAVFLVRTFNLP